jgi:hypothetical protein
VIDTNNQKSGYIYWCISFILMIITWVSLEVRGLNSIMSVNMVNANYGMKYLIENVMYYMSIVFGLLGYTYIYGEGERDFYWWVMLPFLIFVALNNLPG